MPKKRCPHCSEGRSGDFPLSENVVDGTTLWHCHRCGYSGSNKQKGDVDVAEHTEIFIKPKNNSTLDPEHLDYIKLRGIDDRVVADLGLYSDNGAIVMPYFFYGDLVNNKRRTLDKRFAMEKGGMMTLYNYDGIDNDCTIITEGEFDAMAIMSATGKRNVVSLPNGANTNFWKEYLVKRFSSVDRVILAGDMDEKGVAVMEELAGKIGRSKCAMVSWPAKDANDTLKEHGVQSVLDCLNNAKYPEVEGIVKASESGIFDYYEHGQDKGLSTGISNLDKNLAFEKDHGQLIVVTSPPGSGKTEFVDQIMVNMAKEHKWKFAVYSPESAPIKYHVSRIAEKYWSKPFHSGFEKRDGSFFEYDDRMSMTELEEAVFWADDFIFNIDDMSEDVSVESLLEQILYLKRTQGIRAAIIDPWNSISVSKSIGSSSETVWITEALNRIKLFCLRERITMFIVAHPTKLALDKKTGKLPVATAYDIKGSSGWFDKACVVISLHRPNRDAPPPECHQVECHIQKVKKRFFGKVGKCQLEYNFRTGELKNSI